MNLDRRSTYVLAAFLAFSVARLFCNVSKALSIPSVAFLLFSCDLCETCLDIGTLSFAFVLLAVLGVRNAAVEPMYCNLQLLFLRGPFEISGVLGELLDATVFW